MSTNLSDEQLVAEVTAALNAEADAVFPEDRLQRQQARILQRIEQEGRPARVITFPAAPGRMPASLLHHSTSTTRWVAAAAAVAFIAGLGAGQFLPHDFRSKPAQQVAVSRPASPEPTGTTLHASSALVPSDDEFLGEVEQAVQSRPAVLRHIDELTPRAWDVEVGQ